MNASHYSLSTTSLPFFFCRSSAKNSWEISAFQGPTHSHPYTLLTPTRETDRDLNMMFYFPLLLIHGISDEVCLFPPLRENRSQISSPISAHILSRDSRIFTRKKPPLRLSRSNSWPWQIPSWPYFDQALSRLTLIVRFFVPPLWALTLFNSLKISFTASRFISLTSIPLTAITWSPG